jgi:hypothetical protein
MVFTANIPYTVVFIHPLNGATQKDEIEIVGINTKLGRCQYKRHNEEDILTLPDNLNNLLFFQGHHLPLVTGGDTSVGFFNFLSANPDRLENYLWENCQNLAGKEQRIKIHKAPKKRLHNIPDTIYPLPHNKYESVLMDKPFFMIMKDYSAILQHDHGRLRMLVPFTTGEEAAIKQIMAAENCPRCAILSIKEAAVKYIF